MVDSRRSHTLVYIACVLSALLLLDLFASVRLYPMLGGQSEFEIIGLDVPLKAIWVAVLFAALAGLIALFAFGIETGWTRLDSKSRRFIDLLVDTQGELQKVSWPGRQELSRSTIVVLACVLLLGAFLYVVDLIVSIVMTRLDVLPG